MQKKGLFGKDGQNLIDQIAKQHVEPVIVVKEVSAQSSAEPALGSSDNPHHAMEDTPVASVAPQIPHVVLKKIREKQGFTKKDPSGVEEPRISLYRLMPAHIPEVYTQAQLESLQKLALGLDSTPEAFHRVTEAAQDEFVQIVPEDEITPKDLATLAKYGDKSFEPGASSEAKR